MQGALSNFAAASVAPSMGNAGRVRAAPTGQVWGALSSIVAAAAAPAGGMWGLRPAAATEGCLSLSHHLCGGGGGPIRGNAGHAVKLCVSSGGPHHGECGTRRGGGGGPGRASAGRADELCGSSRDPDRENAGRAVGGGLGGPACCCGMELCQRGRHRCAAMATPAHSLPLRGNGHAIPLVAAAWR